MPVFLCVILSAQKSLKSILTEEGVREAADVMLNVIKKSVSKFILNAKERGGNEGWRFRVEKSRFLSQYCQKKLF